MFPPPLSLIKKCAEEFRICLRSPEESTDPDVIGAEEIPILAPNFRATFEEPVDTAARPGLPAITAAWLIDNDNGHARTRYQYDQTILGKGLDEELPVLDQRRHGVPKSVTHPRCGVPTGTGEGMTM